MEHIDYIIISTSVHDDSKCAVVTYTDDGALPSLNKFDYPWMREGNNVNHTPKVVV